jgi:hypothetical protein
VAGTPTDGSTTRVVYRKSMPTKAAATGTLKLSSRWSFSE